MCGVNIDSLITEIVVATVSNEKFFENMTKDERVKAVSDLYKSLQHAIEGDNHNHHHD